MKEEKMLPAIAIITPNTLESMGLSNVISRMMPGAEIVVFSRFRDLSESEDAERFFHYFVDAQEVMSGASFFLKWQRKTIVLVHGAEIKMLPSGFHTLDITEKSSALISRIMSLASHAHGAPGSEPEAVKQARKEEAHPNPRPSLTPRECDVLSGIVKGRINKEIAADLGVSLSTVITHRSNLIEKLGTRSVSAMTIYALSHGLVRSDEI